MRTYCPAERTVVSALKVKVEVAQCLTLCHTMDYAVLGILQARILEWVAFSFSRGSSQCRDRTQVSLIAGRFFTSWATRETLALCGDLDGKEIQKWEDACILISDSLFCTAELCTDRVQIEMSLLVLTCLHFKLTQLWKVAMLQQKNFFQKTGTVQKV